MAVHSSHVVEFEWQVALYLGYELSAFEDDRVNVSVQLGLPNSALPTLLTFSLI